MDSIPEQLNPFNRGSVAFYVCCFALGMLLSRFTHWLVRNLRFTKIRRYGIQKKIKRFNQHNHPDFTILSGPDNLRYCKYQDLMICDKFLRKNFPNHTVKIPQTMCSLWIPRKGFVCGNEFQSFSPIDGRAPGSHLSYQMITDRAQITWYNLKDKRRYVAGICIYLRLESESIYLNPGIEEEVLQKCMEMWYEYAPKSPQPLVREEEELPVYDDEIDGNGVEYPPTYTSLLIEKE